MKKFMSICLASLILLGGLSGCSDNPKKTNTEIAEKNRTIIKENLQLQEQLQAVEGKLQILEEKHDNELHLRNLLDISFHTIIEDLKRGNIDDLKKNVTNNITVNNNILVNNNSKTEFALPKGNYYFRQRFFHLDEAECTTKFTTAYEIIGVIGDELKVCYVDFTLVNGEWKLNSIGIDVN